MRFWAASSFRQQTNLFNGKLRQNDFNKLQYPHEVKCDTVKCVCVCAHQEEAEMKSSFKCQVSN